MTSRSALVSGRVFLSALGDERHQVDYYGAVAVTARLALRYSKSRVDRAADVWRSLFMSDGPDVSPEEMDEALSIVEHYRACHQYPLQKATVGVRSTVKTVGAPVQVSQRLKRYVTILNKLQREPTMKLSRMQDIGGCRAILPDIGTLRLVQRRLEKRRGYRRTAEYIVTPRESGYRGVHVMLDYDERTIEVQLRTKVMHSWAIATERLSSRVHQDLKSGKGPRAVLELLRLVSAANVLEEGLEVVPEALLDAIDAEREASLRYLSDMEGNR